MSWEEYLDLEDADTDYISALGEYFDPDEYEEIRDDD